MYCPTKSRHYVFLSIWHVVTLWQVVGIADDSKPLTVTDWQPLFRGIEVAHGERQLTLDEWQRGVALRVDLRGPGIRPVMTDANGDAPLETDGETTAAFLQRNGLAVAMNVHFFSPCCAAVDGEPKDLTSLAVTDGELISPWEQRMPDVLVLRRNKLAEIVAGDPDELDDVTVALAGQIILQDGKIVGSERKDAFATTRHPRSAIGVSAHGGQLLLLVIDGRRPDHSMGATLVETAQWLAALGASDGLNVDGGGSTTLVAADNENLPIVLNKVSGASQRVVGSNLGFGAAPLPKVRVPD